MTFRLGELKWGTGERGTSGGTVYWSFAQTAGTGFVFEAQISDPAFQAVIREAFQAWENVANIDFVEVADGATSMLRLGWDSMDGPNGTVGEASIFGSKTTSTLFSITEGEIRFDQAENWSTDKNASTSFSNFYGTAVHEIGHAIGLQHVDDPNTIMYPTYTGAIRDLTAGDILGAQTMYGAASVVIPPANVINGTAGNDLLFATPAAETINGFDGIDTVRFSGGRSGYVVTDDNQLTIQARNQADGSIDTLQAVERLQFDDGFLAFDVSGNAGAVYRLYQAAFDRTPDAEGLGFWIKNFDAGNVNLLSMSGFFMQVEEFSTKYGAPSSVSDQAFLTLLYNNVLDRTPDQAGFDFWSAQQANGLSRPDMLKYFSEATETINKVAAAVDDGIWYV